MDMMKRVATTAAVAAVVATGTVVIGGASLSPVSAACALGERFTAGDIVNSEPSYASHGCEGLTGLETQYDIEIKGWYNNGSGWAKSSLEKKWVYAGYVQNKAVVGETMDGVTLKGERKDGANSDVVYWF